MTLEHIDRVFGRGRLKMVTGAHVEVFREAAAPGESRRYTKRFLKTADGDYAQWTEREWRILARLIGHGTRCIPDVVQYDRGAHGTKLVQTYDAGATVDQWATLLPVERDGRIQAHVFEDCAHWWALAHHCLDALDEIHSLELVHLDIKGDNICIPVGPANFDPAAPGQRLFPVFRKLALIDFAFSLVSGETLTTPLPIGWQQDYDYQSPRLLHALEAGRMGDLGPTENLDWRCDMYSLAAMLKRYLPSEQRLYEPERACGWTEERLEAAKLLVLRIRESHDRELTARRAHAELIAETSAQVRDTELAQSLERGWTLARDAQPATVPALAPTPVTRLARPIRLVIPPREDLIASRTSTRAPSDRKAGGRSRLAGTKAMLLAAAAIASLVAAPFFIYGAPWLDRATTHIVGGGRSLAASVRDLVERAQPSTTRSAESIAPRNDTLAENVAAGERAEVDQPSELDRSPAEAAQSTPSNMVAKPSSSADAATKSRPATAVTSAPSSAPAPSRPKSADESLAAQIEAYRSKSLPRTTRTTRAPSTTLSSAGRAATARLAEATRRALLAAGKASRTAGAAAGERSPSAATSKKSTSAVAAVPSPSRTLPTSTAADSGKAAPASVALADATRVQNAARIDANAAGTQRPTFETASATPTAPSTSAAQPSAPEPLAPKASPPMMDGSRSALPSTDAPKAGGPERPAAAAPASPTAPITEASRPSAAAIVQAPRQAAPMGIVRTPEPATPSDDERDDDAYQAQARWTLQNVLPRTSERSRAQVARVLALAATAYHPMQERAVAEVAAAPGVAADEAFVAREIEPTSARRFHDEARRAYWTRRQVAEALELELKAFGANPNDAEIAGHLAFLHLKLVPAQAERARQLALHAIGMRNAHYPTGRPDDWTTFAIASALTGRSTDARHALYASLALTRNADRVCRAALAALSFYGERLREPVEAVLYRVHTQGRSEESPYCAWPVNRIARYP